MKKKSFRSSGLLIMGLVIVLGSIALVNGLWSKTLRVDGTVTTGDVNADWDCAYTNDDGTTTTNCPDTTLNEPVAPTPVSTRTAASHHSLIPTPSSRRTSPGAPWWLGTSLPTSSRWPRRPSRTATRATSARFSLALSNTGSIPFNFAGATLNLPTASVGQDRAPKRHLPDARRRHTG